MKQKGLVLLPVYKAEKTVESIVGKVSAGLKELQEEYDILAIDDGSDDGSFNVLNELVSKTPNLIPRKNSTNLGLAEVLKLGYRFAVDNGYARTLRTDVDVEQDQTEVISKLGRKILYSDVVVGRRRFAFPDDMAEGHLKKGVALLLNGFFGLEYAEPSTTSIAFKAGPLAKVIDTDFLKNYKRRWSFDTSSVVLAKKFGYKVDYVDVAGWHAAERRPLDKVLIQYSTYFQVIDELSRLEIKQI